MKIVITPAKRMYQEIDYFDALSKPIYIKESEIILNKLKTLTKGGSEPFPNSPNHN